MSEPCGSPCVRSCCLNEQDVCLGCGRHLNEITGWNAASNTEKQAILSRAGQRLSVINADRINLQKPFLGDDPNASGKR